MKKRGLSLALAFMLVFTLLPIGARADVNVVYAATAEELIIAVKKSDTRVVLDARTYYWGTLAMVGVENLEIVGVAGTKIVGVNGDDVVVYLRDSKNINISNVQIGYELKSGEELSEGLIKIISCAGISVDNCDLYGGVYGFTVSESQGVAVNNCVVRDCSDRVGTVSDSKVAFDGCTFKDSGYAPIKVGLDAFHMWDGGVFHLEGSSANTRATFNDCVFLDNKNENFKYENWNGGTYAVSKDAYSERLTRANNCTFTNNAWQTGADAPLPPEKTTDGADDWAKAELQQTIDAGIAPDMAYWDWKQPTPRLDAAQAMVALIESAAGKTIWEIADERGWDLLRNGFDDVGGHNYGLVFLKYAGIVEGIGNNKFDPLGTYTRAQAVTMIGRAAEAFFGKTVKGENPFTDVPAWAAPYVGYAASSGITNGIGGGLFNPDGVLTNQETAIFCLRAFRQFTVDS